MLNYFIPAISSGIYWVPKTVWQNHVRTQTWWKSWRQSLSCDTGSCFLTTCPRVRSAQELSVFCEFCHRVGRVKAALEAQRGLSPECHISASKMLNPSMCHLLWLRARLCQLPSGVCDRDWVGGAASSAAATAQEWGTAQYHCIALVLCRRTEGSSFQQGHTGTHSCVAVPGRESKARGTCKWKNIHCMGERQHRG